MVEHIDILEEDLPSDIEEALAWLRRTMPLQAQVELKDTEENNLVVYHHGLGRLLRNSFGLWHEDNKLRLWFEAQGIEHPDTMSSIVIRIFWRWLNDRPRQLADLIAARKLDEAQAKLDSEALARGEVVERDGMRISGCVISVEDPDAD